MTIGALGVVALAAGALTATPTSASISNSDATLISTFPTQIAPVYTTSTVRVPVASAGRPTSAHTVAAASAVSASCAAGNPLVGAQWYALPASGASRITLSNYQPGRTDPSQVPVSFGFVTGDTGQVISCGATVNLPAGRPVLLVVYFASAVPQCTTDEAWYRCDDVTFLATVHQQASVPPANDRWQNATPISGNTFFRTVDTSRATYDGLFPIREGFCFLSQINPVPLGNVWYRYKPSFTGHVNVVARSAKPGYWAWPVIAELGASGPVEPPADDTDECVGTTNVEAGKTYLIGVGGWYVPTFGEPNPIGGEVSLAVTQTAPLPVVRDLNATVDSAAHSATLSWFGRWDESVPVSGLQVSRRSSDGVVATATVTPSTRSYTFTGLQGWEPYLMTVTTIGPSGVVTADSPRATRFVYLSAPQPSRPLAVAARISGVRRIQVTWKEPAFNGDAAISGYRVRQFRATGTTVERTWTLPASARSYVATGLAFRRGYRYDVTAINTLGIGRPSSKTAALTLTGIATAPTAVKVTRYPSSKKAKLTWKAPVDTRGGLITGYKVGRNKKDSAGKGPYTKTVSASTHTVVFKKLVKGRTYTLYVRAITAQGLGAKAIIKVKL